MQFFIFILLLAVPLPLASARPVWEWLWACLIGLSVLLWSWRLVRTKDWPAAAIIVWPIVGLGTVALWGFAQAGFGLSPNPGATMAVAVYFLAHLVWFLMVVAAFSSRQAVGKLVRWLALVGTLYAAYGLLVYLTGNKSLLWYEKWAYPHSLTSTFVNRNSYAAYCGLALQCLLADLLFRYGQALASFDRLSFSLHDFISRHLVRVLWQVASFVILTTALLLTGSRAGILTALIGLMFLVFSGVRLISGSKERRWLPLGWSFVVAAGILLFAAIFNFSGGRFENRLTGFDATEDSRFSAYPLVIGVIENKPLAGYSLGSFEEVFRQYRTQDIPVLFDRAHNDYLELAMTAGGPVTLMLIACFGAVMVVLLHAFRAKGTYKIWILLGLTSSVQLMLHSTVDFSLQIPAVSYSYLAIIACALIAAKRRERAIDAYM